MNDWLLTTKGGALVGWIGLSYPMASLRVNKERLVIDCGSAGVFGFYTHEIESIVRGRWRLSTGIKINHTKKGYEDRVLFFGDTTVLLEKLLEMGFPVR
jgi:hypothetical protein